MEKIKVAVVGAAGLVSGVLLKLLLRHRYVIPAILVSDSHYNKRIDEVHKCLKGLFNNKYFISYNPEDIIEECDLVFLCRHHGEGLDKTAQLIDLATKKGKSTRFIDLSADFRLKDPDLYKEWYSFTHSKPELLKTAIYGLPELNADKIKKATLVANPGCYSTCVILGLAPLASYLSDGEAIIVDAFSGVSGAGRTRNERNMFMDVENNIMAYKVCVHPHTPEIEQELGFLANKTIQITFVPHVVPFRYGIFTTTFLKLNERFTWSDMYSLYSKFYAKKPFIRLLNEEEYPEIPNVEGTNFCDIGIKIDKRTGTYIIMGAIDNVIKGASGQAIQNMNIMFGFNEVEGLPYSEVFEKTP